MRNQRGQILIQTLVLSALAVVFISVLVSLANYNIVTSTQSSNSEQAFQIAESGIEYYRWHLAHSPQDFQDGKGVPGPYYHDFLDKSGTRIGQFALTITAPPVGSTVVTILATATTTSGPGVVRKIQARLAIPSLAKYATLSNTNINFGVGATAYGPVHSNGGVRFDGVANNVVTSALTQYKDPSHQNYPNDPAEFGVHTHVSPIDPLPPNSVPNRSDVFKAGRQFPVPAVDFTGITANLAQIKADANTPNGRYFLPSGALGYHIILKTNGTFDLRRVTSLVPPPNVPPSSNYCTNSQNQTGWGTWSIQNETPIQNYAFPANGLIFTEDNVWVDGQINNARLTIAAGLFPDPPGPRKSITINHNLTYTNYNGQDAIGLIAQGDINVGMVSDDNLRIDAAVIAQNGRVGRYYYKGPSGQRCSPYHVRQTLTMYGMLATNQQSGFAYGDGTGYQTRTYTYDANLLYAPPPSFPLTSNQYQTISWQEVK